MIKEIYVNGRVNPLGVDDAHPVISFSCETAAKKIKSYSLKVDFGGFIVFDTGIRPYEGSNYILYEGASLDPVTPYSLFLQVEDEEGKLHAKEGCFETGFLGNVPMAEWIEPVQETAEEEAVLPFKDLLIPNPSFWGGEVRLKEIKQLRKSINIKGPVRRARIYATAHGVYNLYLNGEKVAARRFAPENSAYKNVLYYQTYDVTSALKEGENVIGAYLADGWWIGRLGMSGESCNYGNKLGFWLQAKIEYEDGTKEFVVSDKGFESASSYIRYSDLYIGEKQDASMKDEAWMKPGYDASGWKPCIKADYDKGNFCAQPMEGVCAVQELPLKEIITTPKGELVLDFGQVIAGVVRLEIEAKQGDEVILEHGEVLDKEGNYINNILGRNKDQKDVFVCVDGIQTFEPMFTYHGFRYVRVQGIDASQIRCAYAVVIGSQLEKTGFFECSDEDLNKLQHCIDWSTKGNMFCVPTDCPQREKLGWTGDIQVYARTACFNYDMQSFLGAWLMNVRAEQNEEGEIPVVVPNPIKQEQTQRIMSGGSNSSAAWGDACVLVPWYLYEAYGNKKILEENFAMMQAWLGYIKKNCEVKPEGYENFTDEQKARNPYLWTKQYHFGDWLVPSLRDKPGGIDMGVQQSAAFVGASFYAITVSYFIKVCEVLGKEDEAAQYTELLGKIQKAVRDEFIAEDGTINSSQLQGLYVIAVYAGIATGELKQKVIDKLVALIEENGGCLDTGFASVSYLLDVLAQNGHLDTAYSLLYQTKAPSWLYMVKNGATTMWENWRAVLEDGTRTESSYNHYAFGCVGDWIYRHIGGINKAAPGYKKIIFAPDVEACGLENASCSTESPYGTVALSWKKTENGVSFKGCVPIGTSAKLAACGQEIELESGEFEICLP